MRLLIAISSCYDFEKNGNNQVLRDTWLQDAGDYKFFFGTGQGAEDAADQTDLTMTAQFMACMKPARSRALSLPALPADAVLLPDVEDDYGHLSAKTQASLRWAAERDYDFVYRCFPDTYCRPERLSSCGFEAYDYYGDFRTEHCTPDNYPSGGPGYVLSRRAFELLLTAPIEGVHRVAHYAEDLWVGQILNRHRDLGLRYFDDQRFVNRGTRASGPLKDNYLISTHLSCPDRYHPDRMLEKHSQWLASQ